MLSPILPNGFRWNLVMAWRREISLSAPTGIKPRFWVRYSVYATKNKERCTALCSTICFSRDSYLHSMNVKTNEVCKTANNELKKLLPTLITSLSTKFKKRVQCISCTITSNFLTLVQRIECKPRLGSKCLSWITPDQIHIACPSGHYYAFRR
jgi:hypothetical protein